jgi:sterol desaturase/sphingolipid hydroxylase (fatty acid hydroxylase superfamily)
MGSDYDPNHIQAIAVGISFFVLYLAEHIFPQRKDIINYKHELFNVFVGVANQTWLIFAGMVLFYLLEVSIHQKIGILHQFDLPYYIKFPLEFILIDCFMYWWHRLNHVIPFLWRFHSFHHKDQQMNSTSALRFHTGELFLSVLVRLLVFPLVGIDPILLIIYSTILFAGIVIHHSNIKISENSDLWFRKVFVSPRMHRIHHSNIRRETDSNYSSVFPYWDKIFKTYNKYPEAAITFGIDEKDSSLTNQ